MSARTALAALSCQRGVIAAEGGAEGEALLRDTHPAEEHNDWQKRESKQRKSHGREKRQKWSDRQTVDAARERVMEREREREQLS